MKTFLMVTAAAIVALGLGAVQAQEITLEGALVLLTEVPGASNCQEGRRGAPLSLLGTTSSEAMKLACPICGN